MPQGTKRKKPTAEQIQFQKHKNKEMATRAKEIQLLQKEERRRRSLGDSGDREDVALTQEQIEIAKRRELKKLKKKMRRSKEVVAEEVVMEDAPNAAEQESVADNPKKAVLVQNSDGANHKSISKENTVDGTKKKKKKKRKTESVTETEEKEEETAKPGSLQQSQPHETAGLIPVGGAGQTKGQEHGQLLALQKLLQAQGSGKPRHYTVSIALPGSIVANAQSAELRTYVAGQIARAACIFNVDEIVVFTEDGRTPALDGEFKGAHASKASGSPADEFLARVLQYLETPQYLRRALFPVHKDLQYAGLLNPLDAPHHMRISEDAKYREGTVVKRPMKSGAGSWVNVGLRVEASIDRVLPVGMRVTVEIADPVGSASRRRVEGTAVSPSDPREKDGIYWGYSVRLAAGLSKVFTECPHDGGYDLCIGTSERGKDMHSSDFSLPSFKHVLIVFGGLGGLEDCVTGDSALSVTDPAELFDFYINACPNQGTEKWPCV